MKVTFRFAQPEDSTIFHNLLLADKTKVMRQLGITGINQDLFTHSDYKATFAAMVDATIVGFAKASGGDVNGFNYISIFYISSKYRKKGIGKELMQFVESYAKQNWNANGINLYTIDNPPMEGLVRKMGFKLSGTFKKDYCINGKYYNTSRWYKPY